MGTFSFLSGLTKRFGVDPKVAGNQRFSICPEHGQKGDPPDHPFAFATPVASHEFHLLSGGLVQSGVIQDRKPLPFFHERLRFLSRRLCV